MADVSPSILKDAADILWDKLDLAVGNSYENAQALIRDLFHEEEVNGSYFMDRQRTINYLVEEHPAETLKFAAALETNVERWGFTVDAANQLLVDEPEKFHVLMISLLAQDLAEGALEELSYGGGFDVDEELVRLMRECIDDQDIR